jgi:hypothetical protein
MSTRAPRRLLSAPLLALLFDGRDHWIIASPGWQEVADYMREWIEKGQAGVK